MRNVLGRGATRHFAIIRRLTAGPGRSAVRSHKRRPAGIYRVLESKLIHTGRKFRLELCGVPDREGRLREYEVIRHPGAAVILPLLDDQTVVLIENDRVAVGKTLLELPAGTLNGSELPLDAAGRELAEETGYRAGRLEPLLSFYSSPGFCDERLHAFVARDLTPGPVDHEPGERIRVRPMEYRAALEAIQAGGIVDGKSIVTLLYFAFYRAGGG